jgi:hypothetical protein
VEQILRIVSEGSRSPITTGRNHFKFVIFPSFSGHLSLVPYSSGARGAAMERGQKSNNAGNQVRFFTGRTAAGLAIVILVTILILIGIRYWLL